MLANEQDPAGLDAFDALPSDVLFRIHQHCAFLEYKPLMQRIQGRLKGKFYGSLPTGDDNQALQKSIPELYQHAISCLSKEMINPWTCNYTSYYALVETNEVFRKDLGKAIRELLDARVKNSDKYYRPTKNPHVIWAIRYRENVLSGVPPSKFKNSATQSIKSNKQTEGAAPSLFYKTESPAKDSTDTLQATEGFQGTSSGVAQQQNLKAKKSFTCHKCGGEGHMARKCQAKIEDVIEKTERPPSKCYGCGETGHIHR
jgi:hypothetical protein